MSVRSTVLFDLNGKATVPMLQFTKARAPAVPLVAREPLVNGGMPTRYMTRWWPVAFPTRQALPVGRVAEKDGRGTNEFWVVFN